MGETAVALVAVLALMGVADAVWLTTMTERFYRPALGGLLRETPSWAPAIGFYLLYAGGVMVLVISPALTHEYGLGRVALTAATLGVVAYGTYDLTNQATVRGWSARVTIVDIAWGGALTASVSVLSVILARQFG
jgi:uncharacterized membrane protein